MKLFEYKNYKVQIADEALTLSPFKKIHDRDKTKGKERAFKELAFIYHMCDIKSDFLIIGDEEERAEQIKAQVDLDDDWNPDEYVKAGMELYRERTISPTMALYLNSVKAAMDTGQYLSNTGALLAERNVQGNPIVKLNEITGALDKISKIIKDLKASEKEVIKEQQEREGRMKGSQEMGMFEDGI